MKVYECAHFELDTDDPSGCGETWMICHHPSKQNRTCDIDTEHTFTYCQKFCPFFKEGKLKGEWKISEGEKAQAIKVKKNLKEKGFY